MSNEKQIDAAVIRDFADYIVIDLQEIAEWASKIKTLSSKSDINRTAKGWA